MSHATGCKRLHACNSRSTATIPQPSPLAAAAAACCICRRCCLFACLCCCCCCCCRCARYAAEVGDELCVAGGSTLDWGLPPALWVGAWIGHGAAAGHEWSQVGRRQLRLYPSAWQQAGGQQALAPRSSSCCVNRLRAHLAGETRALEGCHHLVNDLGGGGLGEQMGGCGGYAGGERALLTAACIRSSRKAKAGDAAEGNPSNNQHAWSISRARATHGLLTCRCTAGSRTTPPVLTCGSGSAGAETWGTAAAVAGVLQARPISTLVSGLQRLLPTPAWRVCQNAPLALPQPTCSFPASNCGLISTTASPSGRSTSHTCGAGRHRGMEPTCCSAVKPAAPANHPPPQQSGPAASAAGHSIAHTTAPSPHQPPSPGPEPTASSTLSTEMKERSRVTRSTGRPPMSGRRSARRLVRSITRTRGSVRTRSATCQMWSGVGERRVRFQLHHVAPGVGAHTLRYLCTGQEACGPVSANVVECGSMTAAWWHTCIANLLVVRLASPFIPHCSTSQHDSSMHTAAHLAVPHVHADDRGSAILQGAPPKRTCTGPRLRSRTVWQPAQAA